MFILFFASVFTALFPVSHNEGVSIYKKLSGNTVVMAKTYVYHRYIDSHQWVKVKDIQSMTSMNIYCSNDKQHVASVNDGKMVFRDAKYDIENIFFFTANQGSANYTFEFILKTGSPGEYALKVEMFEGKPYSPEIISGVDYQMNWLTQKIHDLLDFAKNNFEIQRMGDEDEVEYVVLYNSIFSLLLKVTLAKIAVLLATILYFNKEVNKFFVSKKIVK